MKKFINKINGLYLVLSLSLFFSAPVYSTNYLTSLFSFGDASEIGLSEDNDGVDGIMDEYENNIPPNIVDQRRQRNHGWLHTMFGDNIDVKPFTDAATDLCKKLSHTLGICIGIDKPVSEWTREDYAKVKEKVSMVSFKVEEKWKQDLQPFLNNFKNPLHKVETAAGSVKSVADSLVGLILWMKVGIGCLVLVAITGFFYMLVKLKDRSKRLERVCERKKVSRRML